MDSQITSPAAPDPLAAMLQNATIDKAKGNDFSNSAGDIFKFDVNNNYYNFTKEGENRVLESSDAIDFFRNVVQPFLAEVRKNDQYRSTVAETTVADGSDSVHQTVTTDHTLEGDPVDIVDIVPPEPSPLPDTSIADRYTRSMLKSLVGYPLYDPNPFSELSKEYPRNGVNVGDVGFVRGDGSFEFLFSICPSNNGLINPPNLPDGFSLETPDQSATKTRQPSPGNTSLFQTPITRTNSGEYVCEGSEGAILELPDGAVEDEATNIRPFEKLAARHGVQWYEYTMTRGRKISNGSLYLITSSTKCTQWGTAVFDRPCAPGQGLRFDKKTSFPFVKSIAKYHWKGSCAFPTKVSNPNQGDAPNQCVFLRGYKIMIREDIFDNLCSDQPDLVNMTRQRATRIRGGVGPDPTSRTLAGGGLFSRTTMSTKTKSDEVVLHANFNSSLIHPSDLINAELLSKNPNSKVALTHDDIWCNLLRDNFPKIDYTTLINIARSYTNQVDEYDCVSLQRIYDSSNVLEESNRPLQRPDFQTFPRPLTIADDDRDIPVPALLRELVERILLLLDTKDILTCRLVNREFNEITQSSILLQYFLACKAAGVIDNPRSTLSYGERLKALLKQEDAWRTLKPMFETKIKFDRGRYDVNSLTGGVLFFGGMEDLHYYHLPSSPQDNLRLNRIPSHGPGEGSPAVLVNFARAVYEHDLIINIISSDIGNQADTQQHSLDLVLLKFSTGEYHPLARHPRIHIQRSPEDRPVVMPTIVGDNLALIVHSDDGTFPDKLFIFDWKTGHKRLEHETTENKCSDIVFVSPEILLVFNFTLSRFEVWHLPPSHPNCKPPVQILILQMPAISRDYSILGMSCSGEPNPFLHSLPYLPPRPFFSSPEDSIIRVELYLQSLHVRTPSAKFTLIMRRRALLDIIQKWTSSSLREQPEDLPMWLMNEVTVHKITDPDDGSLRLDTQSKFVSMMPHPRSPLARTPGSPTFSASPTPPTSHISTDSGSSSIASGSSTAPSTTQYSFLQVQWADWGPPISRWFQRSNDARGTASTGQRYAFFLPIPRDERKVVLNVADFNQRNFRTNMDMVVRLGGREGKNRGADDNNEKRKEQVEEEELERFDHKGVFSEDVYMGLKCVIYQAPDNRLFEVLMDEERLMGVQLNDRFDALEVKVIYFG